MGSYVCWIKTVYKDLKPHKPIDTSVQVYYRGINLKTKPALYFILFFLYGIKNYVFCSVSQS